MPEWISAIGFMFIAYIIGVAHGIITMKTKAKEERRDERQG